MSESSLSYGLHSKLDAKKAGMMLGFSCTHKLDNGRFMPGPNKKIFIERLKELLEDYDND